MKYELHIIKDIVSSFFKRAALAVVGISILSSLLIYFYQHYSFYDTLAKDIKANVDAALYKYNENLKYTPRDILQDDVKNFMQKHDFIMIEIYDDKKEEFYGFKAKGKKYREAIKLLDKHDEYVIHEFPKTEYMSYNFFEIEGDHYFLQIFYPIYKNEKLLGYIEGISYVDKLMVSRFKRGIVAAIINVLVTIIIFSLSIFPIIYFAYKKLSQNQKELLSSNIMTINTLGSAIALRDSDTNKHNYRVTIYAIKLAEVVGLDRENIKKLIKGAFLHDVGKIGISDNILLKNGNLNEEEFKIMKNHVIKGIDIVKNDSWLSDGQDVILCHHEKFDGSGYPNSLEGYNIPITARIFSIVDVFDALTSKRPYKDAFSYKNSIEIIIQSSGTHFDPSIVEMFLKISNQLYKDIKDKDEKSLKKELEDLIEKYFLH